MKALLMRITAGVIALGGLLYFLACNPAPQNNNSSQNQTVAPNQNQAANGNVSAKDSKPCEYGSEPGTHAQHIKKEIEDKMNPSLKKLLKSPQNPNGTFTVEIA